MGDVGENAMRRTLLPLLTVFALLLVAAGGAAAGDAGTTITDDTPDATPSEGDVGICVVGADSPCNDAPDDGENATDGTESTDGERIGDDDGADDGQMRIPEDRNGDGEIDEQFQGDRDGNGTLHTLPADTDTPATHPTPMNDSTEIGSDSGERDEGQMWIPEDQNRDGEIDDRFRDSVGPLAALLSPLLGAF
jgi:hypothetical protein